MDRGFLEQFANLGGLWGPVPVKILFKVFSTGVLGTFETLKSHAALYCQSVRRLEGIERRGVKVHIRKVQTFVRTVENPVFRQTAVQVHRSQTDGVRHRVAALDSRHALHVRQIRHRRQSANRHVDRFRKIGGFQGLGDVHGTEVARNIFADFRIRQVLIEHGGLGYLENLGTQV